MEQGKETNPIAEIFDEMFTLLEDLETRSVAVLEYLKEQGGVSDEKLAPYLDRAAAASDVRWRAARARMDHLLAPKPKSATEVEKTGKSNADSPQQKSEDAKAASESKDLGKELAPPPAQSSSGESKDDKSKSANAADGAKSKETEPTDRQQNQKQSAPSNSTAPEEQASALAGSEQSQPPKSVSSKKLDETQFDNEKSANQPTASEKPQAHKAAK